MKTCDASSEQSIFRPRPVFCLCISAAMMAPCACNPVVRSVTAMPTLHGFPSCKHKKCFSQFLVF